MHHRKHTIVKHTLFVAVIGLTALTACGALPLPMGFGGGNAQSSTHASSSESHSESHKINGREIGDDDDDDEDAPPARHSKKKSSGAEFGATCNHNSDCASNSCFVGSGDLGYCTKMCDSFSDCPSFWECEKVGNAPQRICQQDAD